MGGGGVGVFQATRKLLRYAPETKRSVRMKETTEEAQIFTKENFNCLLKCHSSVVHAGGASPTNLKLDCGASVWLHVENLF